MTHKPLKSKACKVRTCGRLFEPRNSMHTVCGPACASIFARAKREQQETKKLQAERKADREKREGMKTRSDWMKEAQREFNRFVRLRDRAANHPCISSGRPLDWSGNAVDAGHYRSVGAAPHLRFDERNCHAQSKHDNQYKAGNVVEYRLNLIQRIGLEAVESLESDQSTKHYTIPDLIAIRDAYRAKAKQLEKERV